MLMCRAEIARLQRSIARVEQRVEGVRPTRDRADVTSLEDGLDAIEATLAALDHRRAATHPVSGLAVREALLVQMERDGEGVLGAIAFADFDRLTAFDPALGERVFATSAARLSAMLPPHRFAAQVDRGHVGVWFGRDVTAETARAELDAVAYALGATIVEDGRSIVPQVQLRLAMWRPEEAIEASSFLARTLASFATPECSAAITADPTDVARESFQLEQDLRQAIARRELRLDFQPLVDAGRRRVSGAEALIRWTHDERGAVPPARFVPVVEAMGLASEIGTWALNTALRAANEWAGAGLDKLCVAVNVSAHQLERDDLPMLVRRTLALHGLPAAALEIELTESVATTNAAHCKRLFRQLRGMGVKLAVDDFGTGYSGFSSLRTLAFDKIKIDREFVTDVDRRPDSQAICQSIIALGRGLGIRVLAEGVERQAEFAWLRRHGCRHFQGYYFGRPMPFDAFVAFARDTDTLARLLVTDATPDMIAERLRA